jgi:hypothetical protein
MALIANSGCTKSALILAVSLTAAATAIGARAEIYKCTDGAGSAVFSDKPCGASAEKIVVDTKLTGADLGADDLSAEDYEKKRQQIRAQSQERNRKVADAEAEVRRIKSDNANPAKCSSARSRMADMRLNDPVGYSYDLDYMEYKNMANLYCGN